jgi:hypothetical protein
MMNNLFYEGGVIMARGFMPKPGSVSERKPDEFSGIFYKESRGLPPPAQIPPAPQGSVPPAPVASVQQFGGMLNGLVGNIFENNNWWLWAALLIIFFNPDLRKKLFGKGKEADETP